MSTYLAISGATIREHVSPGATLALGVRACDSKEYRILHPSNDAILAYCDTYDEALALVSHLNSLDFILRKVQVKVGQ